MSGVRVIDKGADAIRSRLADLGLRTISVGFQGAKGNAKHPGSGTRVTDVAAAVLLGTEDTPAHPFFDLAASELVGADVSAAARLASRGKRLSAGLRALGEQATDAVRGGIESTGAVDTGTLRDSVTWEVGTGS